MFRSPQDACEEVRIALSARLDGEATPQDLEKIDHHVGTCRDCLGWQSAAEQATRLVRVQSVTVPDLTERILATAHVDTRAHERRGLLRFALGLSALVQLALAVPALWLTGPAAFLHSGREAASFDIALAVGFALAAWWPERARAFVPVAFVLAGCLTATSIADIAGGATLPTHEISHLAALAQAGLLWALSRDNARRPRAASRIPVTS